MRFLADLDLLVGFRDQKESEIVVIVSRIVTKGRNAMDIDIDQRRLWRVRDEVE